MKRLPRTLIAMGAVTLTATASLAHPKVTRDLLQRFWPEAQSAAAKEIALSDEQEREIVRVLGKPVPKELDHTDYFLVTGKNGPLGMLMNFDPPGVGMGLAVDRDRRKIVKAVIYKRQEGTPPLDRPEFLNQFAGKTATDPFQVGRDIQPVKGAEKESQIIATDVKAALLLAQRGF